MAERSFPTKLMIIKKLNIYLYFQTQAESNKGEKNCLSFWYEVWRTTEKVITVVGFNIIVVVIHAERLKNKTLFTQISSYSQSL